MIRGLWKSPALIEHQVSKYNKPEENLFKYINSQNISAHHGRLG